jgi:predicted RNA-binding protein with PUA domain
MPTVIFYRFFSGLLTYDIETRVWRARLIRKGAKKFLRSKSFIMPPAEVRKLFREHKVLNKKVGKFINE